jgi:outer membrane lipoprotein SlyB
MVIIASTTVVLVCLTGTAALMGWLPSSAATPGSAASTAATASGSPGPAQQLAYRAAQHATPMAHRRPYDGSALNAQTHVCQNCGTVESIHETTTRGDGSGLGAAGGAVVGGLLGNQVGGGHGKQALTVVGAIGGALAGNQIERQARATQNYETTVRMNNGSTRTVSQATQPQWRDGDHVRITDGAVQIDG